MRHYDNGYNRLTDCPTKLVHITEKLVLPPLSVGEMTLRL